MLEYFQKYYLLHGMGPGYIVTNVFYAVAVVILLRSRDQLHGKRNWAITAAHGILMWAVGVVICGLGYSLFGQNMLTDRFMMVAIAILYACIFSKLKPSSRLVRSLVFFACFLHIIPISEPIGELFEEINAGFTWAEHFTWAIVLLLGGGVLGVLLNYSTDDTDFVPRFPYNLMAAVAAIGAVWQMLSVYMDPERDYNVFASACFLAMTLMGYAMFYTLNVEYNQNLELLGMRHKEALDEELLQFSQENYTEIHELRHELQNHMNYIKVLADAGEYDKLRDYAASVCGEAEGVFRFVECGNQVVNAVMNHIIRQADSLGVQVDYQIVLPPEIPFKETEFCSLFSNMLENALEAAKTSGAEEPKILVRILPQQDYLFIHVENSVNNAVPKQRRLSLATTKEDSRTHGYGTRIIRNLVKKYQGSVQFNMHGGVFTTDVMLCLKQEDHSHV